MSNRTICPCGLLMSDGSIGSCGYIRSVLNQSPRLSFARRLLKAHGLVVLALALYTEISRDLLKAF